MTLPSISQTDTSSVVCIPKYQLIQGINDIELGDIRRDSIKVLNLSIHYYEERFKKNEKIINKYKENEIIFETNAKNLGSIIKNKNEEITIANKETKKFKNQRNGIIIGGVVIGVSLVVVSVYSAIK
tara:strand:- start:514 stop:894 length:381 start_codon:yes stop_codon:yes gene_type:complete